MELGVGVDGGGGGGGRWARSALEQIRETSSSSAVEDLGVSGGGV